VLVQLLLLQIDIAQGFPTLLVGDRSLPGLVGRRCSTTAANRISLVTSSDIDVAVLAEGVVGAGTVVLVGQECRRSYEEKQALLKGLLGDFKGCSFLAVFALFLQVALADTAECSGFNCHFPSTTSLATVVLCLTEYTLAAVDTSKELFNLVFAALGTLFHVRTREGKGVGFRFFNAARMLTDRAPNTALVDKRSIRKD